MPDARLERTRRAYEPNLTRIYREAHERWNAWNAELWRDQDRRLAESRENLREINAREK